MSDSLEDLLAQLRAEHQFSPENQSSRENQSSHGNQSTPSTNPSISPDSPSPDSLDDLLAKLDQLRASPASPTQNVEARAQNRPELGVSNSPGSTDRLLNDLKSFYTEQTHQAALEQRQIELAQAQQRQLEQQRQQAAKQRQRQAEQHQQETLVRQRRAAQIKRAEAWLKTLDPHGGEGAWFEEFAAKYDSRLAAAIDYLGALEEGSP